ARLARPGVNVPGFTYSVLPLVGRWVGVLKELPAAVRRVTFLFNPLTAPWAPFFLREFRAVPPSFAVELSQTPVHDDAEIEAAATAFAREPSSGLIVAPDPFLNTHRGLVMALAERHRLPAIYGFREFVTEGALVS